MIKDNYLDISKIIRDKKVLKLFKTVESVGGILRFVGGSVRDALAGIEGFDLDLATDLSPDELVEACEEKGLRTVPIGIKYGTVGVIIDNSLLEVTSLRKDLETDGRHATKVEFTADWEIDASRRDLTINAVYADEKGHVFDYYNGVEDLEKGIVRFIGKPDDRIKEDYLRILRFFRFHSIFSKGKIDEAALKACIKHRKGLKKLSIERISKELEKIMLTPKAVETVKIMLDNDILDFILPNSKHWDEFYFMTEMTKGKKFLNESIRRMFVMYFPDKKLAANLAIRLKMTRKHRECMMAWSEPVLLEEFLNEDSLLRLVYRHGKEFCKDKMLIEMARKTKEVKGWEALFEKIDGMIVPILPIRGKDLVTLGIENTRIGQRIKELEEIWIESGFKLSRNELLKI